MAKNPVGLPGTKRSFWFDTGLTDGNGNVSFTTPANQKDPAIVYLQAHHATLALFGVVQSVAGNTITAIVYDHSGVIAPVGTRLDVFTITIE